MKQIIINSEAPEAKAMEKTEDKFAVDAVMHFTGPFLFFFSFFLQ